MFCRLWCHHPTDLEWQVLFFCVSRRTLQYTKTSPRKWRKMSLPLPLPGLAYRLPIDLMQVCILFIFQPIETLPYLPPQAWFHSFVSLEHFSSSVLPVTSFTTSFRHVNLIFSQSTVPAPKIWCGQSVADQAKEDSMLLWIPTKPYLHTQSAEMQYELNPFWHFSQIYCLRGHSALSRFRWHQNLNSSNAVCILALLAKASVIICWHGTPQQTFLTAAGNEEVSLIATWVAFIFWHCL